MWLDSDAIIVDPEPDIRVEIKPETFMLLCTHQGIQPFCTNSGVWIVKRNPKSTELLEAIGDQTKTNLIENHP
ncbi:hypothetical protein ABLO26_19420 [Neobacillus sp. 179-J 1A1 HS]|uniref:hypothetical protein n=1 Tax=Neobacillus driksii TaxID=3035913 RepID=UPI0035BBB942